MLLAKLDEKAQKTYVDYHVSQCIQKEAMVNINDRIAQCTTRAEYKDFEALTIRNMGKFDEKLTQFQITYAP